MKRTILLHRQETDIDVSRQGDQIHVTYNGQTIELQLLQTDGPTFTVAYQQPNGTQQQIRVAGHADGDKRQLWVNGRYRTYQRQRGQAINKAGSGSLAATIPAIVSQILVDVGDNVAVGDKLILLESMKMVIPIQAPYSGIVTSINCVVGDAVQPGVPLLEIEETQVIGES